MKPLIHVVAASAALFLSTGVFAQTVSTSATKAPQPPKTHGFYMKIAGGYFFSVSNGQFPNVGPYPPHDTRSSINTSTGVSTVISDKVLTGSYGAGARGGLSFGWNFNQYIGVEGTFNYFTSSKNLMTKQVTVAEGTSTVLGQVESHGYVHAVDFAPSIVMSPGFSKINPYVRFGVVVPLWGRLNIETAASQTGHPAGTPAYIVSQTAITRHEQIKPNVTIGFQGALGLTFPLCHRFDLFVEAEYRNVPVYGKTKEVTAYDENTNISNSQTGAPAATPIHRGLGDLSHAERYTDYVTTLDASSNTPTGTSGATTNYKDNTKASNDLKSYINIGGLGANVGVKFKF